jgi:hypothetical protein
MVQLAIEYDPHPPHGGIDWSTVDRDSFAGRVEGFAHQALDEHPAMLARVLGSTDKAVLDRPAPRRRHGPSAATQLSA